MVYFLHPETQGLPYASIIPRYLGYSGTTFRLDYPGLSFCDSLGCRKSYPPLSYFGHVHCCDSKGALTIFVARSVNNQLKIIGYPITYVRGVNPFILFTDYCERITSVNVADLMNYWDKTSRLDFPKDSSQGFSIAQTLFYDVSDELACPCVEVLCPEGMVFSKEDCQCVPKDRECKDKQRLFLTVGLKVPIEIELVLVLKPKKGVEILVPFVLKPELGFEIFKYEVGTIDYDGSLTSWIALNITTQIASWVLGTFTKYALASVLGPVGLALSEVVDIGIASELVRYDIISNNCMCVPPINGCPPNSYWNQALCKCIPFDPGLPPPPPGWVINPNGDGYEPNDRTQCDWHLLNNRSTQSSPGACCSQDMSEVLGGANLDIINEDGSYNFDGLKPIDIPGLDLKGGYIAELGSQVYAIFGASEIEAKFAVCGFSTELCQCYGSPPDYPYEPPTPCRPWVGYWMHPSYPSLGGLSFSFKRHCGNKAPKGPGSPWVPVSPPILV